MDDNATGNDLNGEEGSGLIGVYITIVTILLCIIGSNVWSGSQLSDHEKVDAKYHEKVNNMEALWREQITFNKSFGKSLQQIQLNQVLMGSELGVEIEVGPQ